MRRFSRLNVSRFCSASHELGEKHGAGRRAMLGTVAHALWSGDPQGPDLYRLLTADEKAIVDARQKPADIVLEDGTELSYDAACTEGTVEGEVALDADGLSVPYGDPRAITQGHPDLWWVRGDTLYLADIKSTSFSEPYFLDSLQLHAAAIALCAEHDLERYVVGLWFAEEAEWHWGQPIDLDSREALDWWQLIKAAATHETGYTTGPHCQHCWERQHCPEYMLPPEMAETSLAPLIPESGVELTPESAFGCLSAIQRLEKMAETAKVRLKMYADEVGGIPDGAGKVWGKKQQKGRKSLDTKAVEKALKDAGLGKLADYQKQGAPFDKYDWRKA